ncbi:RNA polymerase sigma factor [Seonamhaeicola sp.]|uniref:RNA polymerase sigma factor n=1 Tax=Seonamhaeicola sp. TaxID=1912245 RepID=UPI002609CC4E|nr:RNA polymerase sigma factor [Seonamhaeicola sp.]
MNHQSENSKKLNEFFNEEYTSLKTYVGSKLKSSIYWEPEDIVQDVALKLFAGADRYSPINNVAGFVYRAIKNKVIDVMRAGSKQMINDKNQNEEKLAILAESLYETTESEHTEEMKDTLKKAIIDLKPPYRDIIIAIDFEGYTYKEIEAETGIPMGTLMSRRHRAISLLYKTLKSKKEIIN